MVSRRSKEAAPTPAMDDGALDIMMVKEAEYS